MVNSGPRTLVTGAGGFVGRHITEALLIAGHQVLGLDLAFDPDLRAAWSGHVTMLAGTCADLPDGAFDHVVHAAALTAGPEDLGQTPEANLRANIVPLMDILAWSEKWARGRLLLLSSSAVFRATPPGPVTEQVLPQPEGLYAIAKYTAELTAETLKFQYQRDVAALRLSFIYGPGEMRRSTRPRISLVGRMLQQAVEEGRLEVETPDILRDWTYAPDIGRAIAHLLAAPQLSHALYHIASGEVFGSELIAAEISRHIPDLQIEKRPAGSLTRQGHLVSERLRDELGFDDWTPFAEGLRSLIEAKDQKERLT